MVIKRKNSKLLSRPKTSQNLKFCFIRIAHLMTYIRWLWSLLCITIFFILLIYELNYSCTYIQKDIISIKNNALKNWRLLIKIVLFEAWKFTYVLNWFEKCPYLEIECKIILHCYKKNWNDNTVFRLCLVLTLNHGCIYFQQSNYIFLKLKFFKFVHPLGKN